MAVLVAIKKLTFIVLSVFLFESSSTVVLVVPDSSVIFGSICLSEAAVSILLDIINKISFIDISVCIFEDSLSVFLAVLELSLKMVSIAIGKYSFSIEIASVKVALILVALLSPLEFDQDSVSVELTRPEGAIVFCAIFLFQLTFAFKLVVFEVSSVASPVRMLVLSIS